uniref:Protein kinase C binding protein 1, like n=1 Tax=Amphilophus citrinellus TaxID=61819 RepID=A0A3Q0QSN2_AMPCI
MHPQSLAEEEIKTESDVVEGMDASVRSKVPDPPGSGERSVAPQKRKVSSPTHSSNGHSPSDTSPSPLKKKKKPGAMNCNSKDQKITVAECIETQSKAMTMLTIDQLSYLLKFALQKIKQPGTEPFQKPVSLEQHPDYAEYIFHPMDLCTLEKVQKNLSCSHNSRTPLQALAIKPDKQSRVYTPICLHDSQHNKKKKCT